VSLTHLGEYAIYDGKITIDKKVMEIKDFLGQIKEFQAEDKVAKRTHIKNKEEHSYMVGALARLNNNRDELNPEAKNLLEKSKIKFPNYNPFYNILAQAIEIIHCFEESIKILEILTKQEIKVGEMNITNRTGEGIGAIEAPRGTLFYSVKIKDGIATSVNIITPTAQNLANLEDDLEEFEKIQGFKNLNLKEKQNKIKMLIRAYDPCVTCSVH
jgi:coenzyme F420-reducing hydrogenase alpha subunit